MTYPDAMKLLTEKVTEFGQAAVGRMLGYANGSIVCQVLNGTYNNGNTTVFMAKVIEVFGGLTVDCPVLGEISLSQCSEQKRQGLSIANSTRIELFKTCPTCTRRGNHEMPAL